MKQITSLSLIPALALLAASPLLGQDAGKGMPADDGNMQSEYQLPVFVKAGVGFRAVIKDEAGEQLGHVEDHIVDRATGKVRFVVVATMDGEGEQSAHLVPFRSFYWDAQDRELTLPISKEALLALPAYDATKVQTLGGADAIVEETKDGGMTGDVAEASMSKVTVRHLTATTVLGSDIHAMREEFSAVGDLLLDPVAGTIAFVLARNSAGDPYIIPWKALTWKASERATEGSEHEGGHFVLAQTAEVLADAPKLRGGEPSSLKDKATIEEIYKFFKLSVPVLESKVSGRRER